MKYILWTGVLVTALAVSGCAKKEAPAPSVTKQQEASRAMLMQGTVLLKQGEVVKAAEMFAGSIKMNPDSFDGYLMLGEMFLNLKQYPQAVSVMGTAVRQFPNNGLAYYMLALAHQGAEQPVPAIVAARRSLELFSAVKDPEGMKRSAILLEVLVQSAKQEIEARAAAGQ